METEKPTAFGPYRVVRKLGSGGMGSVYEAKHEVLGRAVAIKTLGERAPLTSESRARFLREARAAARVRHRNVAQVHDICVQDETPYMVLELLLGQTLAQLLETEVRLREEVACDLLVPIVAGVAAAHDCGIVHRDLKPQNLFISDEQSNVIPRVLDFGISKLVDDEVPVHTRSDLILGTAHYLSPEQARGSKNLDARSDQYSLGVVLYECVTGHKAFDDDNLLLLINRIGAGEFKRPSELHPSVSPELEAVILKAMSLLAADRFATTAEFGQALLPFASYKTRLNYAREFARSGEVAATSPITVDHTLGKKPSQPNVDPQAGARSGAPPGVNLQPIQSPLTSGRSRQVAMAIVLLSFGVGVGYSLKFASKVSKASAPNSEIEATVSGVLSNSGVNNSVLAAFPVAPSADARDAVDTAAGTATTALVSPEPSARSTSAVASVTGHANSSRTRTSVVAGPSSFGQKASTAATPVRTSASSVSDQNRARKHGLVQETPF